MRDYIHTLAHLEEIWKAKVEDRESAQGRWWMAEKELSRIDTVLEEATQRENLAMKEISAMQEKMRSLRQKMMNKKKKKDIISTSKASKATSESSDSSDSGAEPAEPKSAQPKDSQSI